MYTKKMGNGSTTYKSFFCIKAQLVYLCGVFDTRHKHMEKMQKDIPYEKCLNCGTELVGKFCHQCGQQATSKTPKMKDFVLEYLNNAFIWDAQFFKTMGKLVCRPGQLTNEYMEGKFCSQEHPLKLNMFLLFVFVSMFLLFSGPKKDSQPESIFEKNEIVYFSLQVEFLKNDQNLMTKLNASPRDTVLLYAPLSLAATHADIAQEVTVLEDTKGQGLDRWVAVVPRVLIEERIIIPTENDYYTFNTEDAVAADELGVLKEVWIKLADIVTTYFPIIMLLTMPLLAMAVAFIQRKNKLPFIHHVIFSLHYTAFLELLFIVIYTLYLFASPSMELLVWILRLGIGSYLAIAFRKVYEPHSWVKAIVKALFTYLVYVLNCLLVFTIIILIACFMAAAA